MPVSIPKALILKVSIWTIMPLPHLADLSVFLACYQHQVHHPGTASGLVAPEEPRPVKRIALLPAGAAS